MIRFIFLLGALLCASSTSAGEFWQFGVYLGDKRIGEHRFEVNRDDSVYQTLHRLEILHRRGAAR